MLAWSLGVELSESPPAAQAGSVSAKLCSLLRLVGHFGGWKGFVVQ